MLSKEFRNISKDGAKRYLWAFFNYSKNNIYYDWDFEAV